MKVTIGPYKDDDSKRKVQVCIHEYDTWSMDHTLALIALPMLKQLQKTKHGAPNVDWEDVPRELRPSQEELRAYNHDGETDANFFKRWDYVLDEMIFAFTAKTSDDWEAQFWPTGSELSFNKLETVGIGPAQLLLFPDEDGENEEYELYEYKARRVEWDRDGYKKYQDRISNGFRLFGKYYESLWD